jgi:hypothetical protein
MSGITDLRVALNIGDLTMRYEDGGRTQVFMFDGKEVKVAGSATTGEIVAALAQAKNKG